MFSDNYGSAILCLNGAGPTITGNSAFNCGNAIITAAVSCVPRMSVASNSTTGNTRNEIMIPGGSVGEDVTWLNFGVPYWISDDLSVEAGFVLTINPGSRFRFSGSTEL